MILRGGPESNVTVNETKFFGGNVSESISGTGITESTGILLQEVRIRLLSLRIPRTLNTMLISLYMEWTMISGVQPMKVMICAMSWPVDLN